MTGCGRKKYPKNRVKERGRGEEKLSNPCGDVVLSIYLIKYLGTRNWRCQRAIAVREAKSKPILEAKAWNLVKIPI